MLEYLPVLQHTALFAGVQSEEIAAMLTCLQARLRRFPKGSTVLREGDRPPGIGVLAEGRLHIQKDDYWGSRSILGQIEAGDLFGEAYSAPESGVLPHDVVAVEDSAVIFFDAGRVLTTCPSACPFHAAVVKNLFLALSEKNRALVQKLEHMSRRTTREKLLSYLSGEAKRQHSAHFFIPFNRQQLADYLSVDRSALSAELGRMRDEGLLRFCRSEFELL